MKWNSPINVGKKRAWTQQRLTKRNKMNVPPPGAKHWLAKTTLRFPHHVQLGPVKYFVWVRLCLYLFCVVCVCCFRFVFGPVKSYNNLIHTFVRFSRLCPLTWTWCVMCTSEVESLLIRPTQLYRQTWNKQTTTLINANPNYFMFPWFPVLLAPRTQTSYVCNAILKGGEPSKLKTCRSMKTFTLFAQSAAGPDH